MKLRSCFDARAIFVGFAVVTLVCVTVIRAEPEAPLVVRLYNTARIPMRDLSTARAEADQILRETGLPVIFRNCGSATANGETIDRCDETLKSSEVVVRIIDAPTFNATLDPDAYGVTYIVNDLNRGWLATVFADRTRVAAMRVDVDPGTLVGRVMAHEIGHLLLGRDYHGNVGVMQAAWSDAMLTRPGDEWRFTMPEAARMRQIRSLLR
jgi:hypothetical protein